MYLVDAIESIKYLISQKITQERNRKNAKSMLLKTQEGNGFSSLKMQVIKYLKEKFGRKFPKN